MLITPFPGFTINPLVAKHRLLSFKINGVVQKTNNPQSPPSFPDNATLEFIVYTGNPNEAIDFVFFGTDPADGCDLFLCDRNIVNSCSWNHLNSLGFITGKTLTLAGLGNILIRSPKGGTSAGQKAGDNEWDDTIGGFAYLPGMPLVTDVAHDDFWHWKNVYTWCQEAIGSHRVLRGLDSARLWYDYDPSYAYYGFRPVLKNLQSGNLKSKKYFDLALRPYPGDKVALAACKLNGTIITPASIAQGNAASALEFVSLTGTDSEAIVGAYLGQNIDGNDEFLAERPIVCGVSYDRLNAMGLIDGLEMNLPALGRVKVRAPKGGLFSDGASLLVAGPSTAQAGNNEYDDSVGGLRAIPNAPALPASPAANDAHDQYWHWSGKSTICADKNATTLRFTKRGNTAPRQWDTEYTNSEDASLAFRPVFEIERPLWDLGFMTSPFILDFDTSQWTDLATISLSAKLDRTYEVLAPTEHTPGPMTLQFPEDRWNTLGAGEHTIEIYLTNNATGTSEAFVFVFTKPIEAFTNLSGGMRVKTAGSLEFNVPQNVNNFTVQFADDARFTRSVKAFTGTASPIAYTGLELNHEYYVRLVGVTDAGVTETSPSLKVRCGDRLEFLSAKVEVADMPTECTPRVVGRIDPRAEQHYYMCNNPFDADANKVWEEVTSVVNQGKYTFTNTTKTAQSWGLQMKVVIDAKTATGDIYIDKVMF